MELWRYAARKSFGFSAENPTGTRNGGTRGKDCEKLRACIDIAPGETVTLAEAEGSGMVTHIWFTGYTGHSFVMRCYWDGCEKPSVEAPVSAFFGCAYDEQFADRDGKYPAYSSAMMTIAPARGLNCNFQMPFRKGMRITMENRGKEKKTLYYMISGWYGEIPEDAMYFHAAYRQEHPVTPGRAYTVLDGVEGRGCFAGLTLAVGLNGHNTCFVEGEAKMYLDGDKYPTMNYTGTEDYFCGAYAFGNDHELHAYQPFQSPYVGMYAILGRLDKTYDGQQRFLFYRWHVNDPVYFEQSFRMTMDNLGWTGPRYDDYTSCAMWYQAEPSSPAKALPSDAEMCMK